MVCPSRRGPRHAINATTGQQLPRTAARSESGISVANGIVIVPGASTVGVKFVGPTSQMAEFKLLDAATGKLLKTFPLMIGNQSASTVVYGRPISVGKRVYVPTGRRRVTGIPQGADNYNAVFMYELKSDQNQDSCDDNNDDDHANTDD